MGLGDALGLLLLHREDAVENGHEGSSPASPGATVDQHFLGRLLVGIEFQKRGGHGHELLELLVHA